MKVRDVMTKQVRTCTSDVTLDTAARTMHRHNCGVLPVVDHLGKGIVVGMITDRDICMALAQTNRPASDILVTEMLSPQLHGCMAGDDLSEALKTMARHQVQRLPVITEQSHLEGILSIDDIVLRALEAPDETGRPSPEEILKTLRAIIALRVQPNVHSAVNS